MKAFDHIVDRAGLGEAGEEPGLGVCTPRGPSKAAEASRMPGANGTLAVSLRPCPEVSCISCLSLLLSALPPWQTTGANRVESAVEALVLDPGAAEVDEEADLHA